MPIHEYHCRYCLKNFDELVRKPEEEPEHCKHCMSKEIVRVVTAPGGYDMDSGPSSVRPKSAGSFKR